MLYKRKRRACIYGLGNHMTEQGKPGFPTLNGAYAHVVKFQTKLQNWKMGFSTKNSRFAAIFCVSFHVISYDSAQYGRRRAIAAYTVNMFFEPDGSRS